MRIQHNIMAMSAYRNYTNNVSAMKKNLERLSSGYKINRAGDDAAGLAISEKMRAQITGLETAQKNAKDGISLVQTAEGALTEVHDMLNRMVELATMSANGTYDNGTDRAQLQKELDQLREEINRIADSANFNGIQLLNGDMDGEALSISSTANVGNFTINGDKAGTGASGFLPAVANDPYGDLGVNTVLHTETKDNGGSSFGIDLHNFTFSNKAGDELTLKIGDDTITIKVNEDATGLTEDLTEDGLAELIKKALEGDSKTVGANGNYTVTVNGTELDFDNGDEFTLGDQAFTVSSEGTVVTFTQDNAPTASGEVVNAVRDVTLSGVTAGKYAKYTVDLTKDANGNNINWAAGDTITIGSKTLTLTAADINSGAIKADFFEANKDALKGYELSYDSGTLTIKATKTKADTAAIKVSYKQTEQAVTHKGTTKDGVAAVKSSGTNNATAKNGETITITDSAGGAIGSGVSFTVTLGTAGSQGFTYDNHKYTASWDETGKITITANEYGDDFDSTAFKLTGNDGNTDLNGVTYTLSGADSGTAAELQYDLSAWTSGTLDINGTKVTFDTDLATSLKNILENGVTISGKKFEATLNADGKTLELKQAANADGVIEDDLDVTTGQDTFVKYTLGGDLALASEDLGADDTYFGDSTKKDPAFVGDYNVQTVNPNTVTLADKDRLASTSFQFTMEMAQDGASITIGDDTFTFTTDKTLKDKDGYIYIGDLQDMKKYDMVDEDGNALDKDTIAANKKNAETNYIAAVAARLAQAAADNEVWSVGVGKDDPTRITLVEKTSYAKEAYADEDVEPKYDLRTEEGIEKSLGFDIPGTITETEASGRGLTLQIGDTADKWNQLKVNIKDTHTDKLGQDTVTNADGTVTIKDGTTLADIKISDQDSAIKAVDVIKRAINQISDIRGTLGATQNRLDHTINNLSVMTENIQDAESTIRDTDIAEEMMAYTKNNILIQSAQAMLAQANQVPQGVLQLLQ